MGEAMVCRTCEWYLVNEFSELLKFFWLEIGKMTQPFFLWFLWRVVWWFLLKMFFVLKMVLGVFVANSLYSCVPIPSHETGSILLYQQVLVLWLKHHRLMVYVWCAALLGMFVGETNLPVPWHEIHDSLRASTAASQDILQGDRKKWIEADRSVS